MQEVSEAKFVSAINFDDFTYSKKKHFDFFKESKFDIELFKKEIDPENCDLKNYQDLLVFAFLKDNFAKGSKILEVGGGKSRILEYFKNYYECWNLDKFEGLGNGPLKNEINGINTVYDLAGNFNSELKDEYFDLVFSISALEHTPIHDVVTYNNILNDMNRVLKKGGLSLHTIDQCAEDISGYENAEDLVVWTNPVIEYFAANQKTLNKFIPLLKFIQDPELYGMSERFYNENWKIVTNKAYSEFGKPFSYNLLWRKE